MQKGVGIFCANGHRHIGDEEDQRQHQGNDRNKPHGFQYFFILFPDALRHQHGRRQEEHHRCQHQKHSANPLHLA